MELGSVKSIFVAYIGPVIFIRRGPVSSADLDATGVCFGNGSGIRLYIAEVEADGNCCYYYAVHPDGIVGWPVHYSVLNNLTFELAGRLGVDSQQVRISYGFSRAAHERSV